MKIISGSSYYYKKLNPFLTFGFLGILLLLSLLPGNYPDNLIFMLLSILFIILNYFFFKKIIWNTADEVFDLGSHLVFKKNKISQKVALTNIVSINYSPFVSTPSRVIVIIKDEENTEMKISFLLPLFNRWISKNPIVEDLKQRIENAKVT